MRAALSSTGNRSAAPSARASASPPRPLASARTATGGRPRSRGGRHRSPHRLLGQRRAGRWDLGGPLGAALALLADPAERR